MKLKQALLPLAALSLAASLATPLAALADDDAAYSANVVGVIKYTIPAGGGLTCIALPMKPLQNGGGSTNKWFWPETSLAQQMARNSIVYFWNGTGWNTSTKQRSGWSDAEALMEEENAILAGQAFFVQGPDDATEPQTISLLGELPMDTQYLTLTGSGNLDMTAITTFPVNMSLADSAFSNLPRDSIVYQWTGSQWATSTKQRSSWSENLEFGVGEGGFVELSGTTAQVVEETCPFNLE